MENLIFRPWTSDVTESGASLVIQVFRPLSTTIGLSRIHFPVTTLGPGSRIGIWMQGCSIQCPGCISMDTWQRAKETTSVEQVIATIAPYLRAANGITITGGEPFDQVESLGALLAALRVQLTDELDVLVYSGYQFSKIEAHVREWPGMIDALISEPFEVSAPQTRPLMGSDNQQLHLLTPLGHARFHSFQRCRQSDDERLDLMMDANGTAWLAGIPRRGDLERLQAILGERGTQIQTSAHKVLPQ